MLSEYSIKQSNQFATDLVDVMQHFDLPAHVVICSMSLRTKSLNLVPDWADRANPFPSRPASPPQSFSISCLRNPTYSHAGSAISLQTQHPQHPLLVCFTCPFCKSVCFIPIPFPYCNSALQSSCIHACTSSSKLHMCATYHSESVSPIWNAISISPIFYVTKHNKTCKSLIDKFVFVSFSHSVCKFMPSVLFCFVVHSLCESDDCLRLISKCGGRLSVCVKYLAHSVCLPC